MSREIKFRAWSEKTKRFTKDSDNAYLSRNDSGIICEQYTGLKDKNGEEIYDGDIVEEDIEFGSKMTDGTFRYKVYWDEDELYWSLEPIGPESIHDALWELDSSRRVIGNIHENPDLIEEVR